MTYLVLARKWRPRSFETLVGQEHVVRALTHALTTQRLHHAWLFTGTRGVGKTTLSRILAKSLNCESGITATPCGVCQACTEIDAGRFVDYLELDAASNRGVDEMTQLLEQAVYSPTSGRFKVYMIDEVHMLTGHAFNAMLKTLEEPPPHVKFILATTDPQKIPVTVLSRCLQFNLKQMPPDAIVGHLENVLAQEALPFEVPALRLIGQAARGSMRDALSLTDQAIAYSAGNLSEEAVRGMLGTIDQRHLVRLLDAVADGDGAGAVAVADELAERSLSYAGALADLAVLLSRIALAQRVTGITADDEPLRADIERLAARLDPDQAQLFYGIAVHSRAELALAPDEYAGFVMACLRMLAFTAEPGEPAQPTGAPPSASAVRPASAGTPVGTPGLRAEASTASDAPAETPVPASAQRPAAASPPSSEGALSPAQAALRAARGLSGGRQGESSRSSAPASSRPAAAGGDARKAAPPPGTPRHDIASAPVAPVSPAPSAPAPVASAPVRPPAAEPGRATAPADGPGPDPSEDDGFADMLSEPPPWVLDGPDDMITAASPMASSSPLPSARPVPPPASAGRASPAGQAAAVDQPASAGGGKIAAARAEVVAVAPVRATAAPAPVPATADALSIDVSWAALAASLPVKGLAAQLAQQSEWVGSDSGTIVLRVANRGLAEGAGVERLRAALEQHLGRSLRLRFEIGETGGETAHAVAQSERQARQQAAEDAIMADPFVRELLDQFGGRIVPDSIVPVVPAAR